MAENQVKEKVVLSLESYTKLKKNSDDLELVKQQFEDFKKDTINMKDMLEKMIGATTSSNAGMGKPIMMVLEDMAMEHGFEVVRNNVVGKPLVFRKRNK